MVSGPAKWGLLLEYCGTNGYYDIETYAIDRFRAHKQ